MKPDYKNWVPKGMVAGVTIGAAVCALLLVLDLATSILTGTAKLIVAIVFAIAFVVMLIFTFYCFNWYNAFSYNGKRQMSKQIIEKIAEYVNIPDGGTDLDIGCGSGALTIAVAKRNKEAKYGDMQAFVKKLKDMGYEEVELLDTTKGLFMTEKESKLLALGGSALLKGKK